MNRALLFLCFFISFAAHTAAQTLLDTLKSNDTSASQNILKENDSVQSLSTLSQVSKKTSTDSFFVIKQHSDFASPLFTRQVLKNHPYFGFNAPIVQNEQAIVRKVTGKELIFYLMIILLIIYALLRLAFPKYFIDLFRLFFRTTIKQRQIKEQLMQTPLPSLLLNIFFIVSGGLYVSFIVQHFQWSIHENFWILFLYCCAGLLIAYSVKFLGLKISGWLFSMQDAANAYIFIVFTVNKVIGILLLPILVLLAFSIGNVYAVSLTLSWCIIAILLFYRFILTYRAVHNQVKVNPFHFFLYLCAFEIAPLLLVYKGLLVFLNQTA